MVHCCEESFFDIVWAQQLQKIIRCLLHDLSNCLTGNLALSELYCAKETEKSAEKFAVIRDNCYKEREILKQLSQLHYAVPGNVSYIDLQAFVRDLQPFFMRLLPAHAKFNSNYEPSLEALIKFDVAYLQRIFLLTTLLETEIFGNISKPELNIRVTCDKEQVVCQIKSSVVLNLKEEDLTEVKGGNIGLSLFYVPMVRFYLNKYKSSFLYDTTQAGTSIINLNFPMVT